MQPFLEFARDYPALVTVGGTALFGAVAWGVISTVGKRYTRDRHSLEFLRTFELIELPASEELTLNFRGRSVPRTWDHTVIATNNGNRALRNVPITIEPNGGVIFDASAYGSRGAEISLKLSSDESTLTATVDLLEPKEGFKTLRTGQRFLEGFECLRALRGGHIRLADLLPSFSASANRHDHVRTVVAAVLVLGMRLGRQPRSCRR